MSKSKEPYYPNNWEALAKAPAEYFQSCSWDDFVNWRLTNWTLPSSVCCVVRTKNIKTFKVQEFAYSRLSSARAKVSKLATNPNLEITIVDDERVHFLVPMNSKEYHEEGDTDDEDDDNEIQYV